MSRNDLAPRFAVREDVSVSKLMRFCGSHLSRKSKQIRRHIEMAWTTARTLFITQWLHASGEITLRTMRIRARTFPSALGVRRAAKIRVTDICVIWPASWRIAIPSPVQSPPLPKLSIFSGAAVFSIPRTLLLLAGALFLTLACALAFSAGVRPQAIPANPPLPLNWTSQVASKAAEPVALSTSEWAEVRRPVLQFALDAPQVDKSQFRQKVFRNASGAREESLIWGSASSPGFHAQVVVYRAGDAVIRDEGLFVAIARRAAANGTALTKISTPFALPTKFGELEASNAQMITEDTARSCLVFRHQRGTRSFGISGWYCGTDEKPAEGQALACFVDRLDILSAGDDVQLQQIFATAERGRSRCSISQADSRRLGWLGIGNDQPTEKTAMGPPIPSDGFATRRLPPKK